MAKKKLSQGSICWANVRDPNTKNYVGEHPVVVLNRPDEIEDGRDLRVVVCSTSCYPMQDGWFEIPHLPHPAGHPKTGLNEACVVKATWQDTVPQNSVRIKSEKHRCPAPVFRQILGWLASKEFESRREAGEPPVD